MIDNGSDWTALSFIGVGPLRYGMAQDEVQAVVGPNYPVKNLDQEEDGALREYRGRDIPICHYTEGRLAGLDTSRHLTNLRYDSEYLYKMSPGDCLAFLENKNGNARIHLNLILFDALGITTNGFYFEKENKILTTNALGNDRRRIGFFKMNAFDQYVNRFRLVSFV